LSERRWGLLVNDYMGGCSILKRRWGLLVKEEMVGGGVLHIKDEMRGSLSKRRCGSS